MSDPSIIIVASFLLAFKAVLLEGSEVAILAVATVKQLGKNNVLAGVVMGGGISLFIFLAVRQFFLLLPEVVVDFGTGVVILYFSYRFLRAFRRYYFGKKSFRDKMTRLEGEVVQKDRERYEGAAPSVIPFSFTNTLPVLAITLTEGFEASLVLGAAGTFNLAWTVVGALTSLVILMIVSAISYEYLLRVPRWMLDLLAGCVLLTFGSFFIVSGILAL
ncbi:MAG TPA: hypothetical protein VLY21_04765 [Nitrososphaerales archaeon]|nr:hypothetical protein [Nitrososphaerales archaeon]